MNEPNERLQILKMIEAGQISAEEGIKLLRALEEGGKAHQQAGAAAPNASSQPRWFRVRVTDLATGRNKVNVNIPIGLVNVGMRLGARFAPNLDGTQIEEIVRAAKSGAQGRIADVEDVEDGERVEIFIE